MPESKKLRDFHKYFMRAPIENVIRKGDSIFYSALNNSSIHLWLKIENA